jgi:hypothetical protein
VVIIRGDHCFGNRFRKLLEIIGRQGILLLTSIAIAQMANPNPRLENIRPKTSSDNSTQPLANEILGARVSVEIDALVRSLPSKTAWLRRVITEAAQRELMKGDES